MLGAIIGDVIGSPYEFHNVKTKEFEVFKKECCFTDDTILTCATAEWLLTHQKPEKILRKWGLFYQARTYENGTVPAFGKSFTAWLKTNKPAAMKTNGCVMRISPIGLMETDLKNAIKKAVRLTKITHNHPESLTAAKAYIETMFLVRKKIPVSLIKNYISQKYGYDLSKRVDDIRPEYNKFYSSCKNTVPQAIICALDSVSYEDAIRNAVSLGGDSDTLACMAGGIAEARFGVPAGFKQKVMPFLDDRIKTIINRFYEKRLSRSRS